MNNTFLSKLDLSVRYHKSIGALHMANYLQNQLDILRKIVEDKKEFLVATFYVPGELLELFDVEVIYIERLAGLAAALRLFDHPVSRAIENGFPAYSCSYQAMFNMLIEEEVIPKPAGFIAMSYTCKDAWKYCEMAASRYGVPFYYIDVPNVLNKVHKRCLAKQLEELYHQLKQLFIQKTDIKDVVTISNKAQDIKSEIDVLRLSNHLNILDYFKLFPLYNDLGKKSVVEILQFFKEKLEKGGAYDNCKVPRIFWLGVLPLYRNSLINDIEKRLNCSVVCEEMFDFNKVKLTCDSFFENLAQRIMYSRFFSLESRIKAIYKTINVYNIKGIIHFSQKNCRFLPPMVPSIRKKMDEMGIPFIELKGDVVDPEYFDEIKAWSHLEDFNQQIHGRA